MDEHAIREYLKTIGNGGGGGQGTQDYEELSNKPQIEGVTLIGDKSFSDLHLDALTNTEIEELLEGSE